MVTEPLFEYVGIHLKGETVLNRPDDYVYDEDSTEDEQDYHPVPVWQH